MSARKVRTAVIAATALTMMGSVAGAGTAAADDFSWPLPAGTACDFPLRIDGTEGRRVEHTIPTKDGSTRVISTGKGSALTFTNEDTGASLSLAPRGAVQSTTTFADGSTLTVLTGSNVVILFPTDVPAGPSTTLHVGRVVFTATPTGDYTVLETRGTSRDLCAELSG